MRESEVSYIQFALGGLESHANSSAVMPVFILSVHSDMVFINMRFELVTAMLMKVCFLANDAVYADI